MHSGFRNLTLIALFMLLAFRTAHAQVENVLFSFGQPPDATEPLGGVIMAKNGNLYGTSLGGGAYGNGTVFQLTPSGTRNVLYSFGSQSNDGSQPRANLIVDRNGNFYGTTSGGGCVQLRHGVSTDAHRDRDRPL